MPPSYNYSSLQIMKVVHAPIYKMYYNSEVKSHIATVFLHSVLIINGECTPVHFSIEWMGGLRLCTVKWLWFYEYFSGPSLKPNLQC